jgi:hypothetical protein
MGKRLIGGLVSAMLVLALAAAPAFAGKGSPNWDSGNKSGGGTDNKQDRGCPKDYSQSGYYGYGYNPDYDMNMDGYVCYKFTNGGLSWVDNTSN